MTMAEKSATPMVIFPASILLGLVIACWIARAPTSYTGKLPLIGEHLPVELNAVYFIVIGPFIGALMAAATWVLIANGWGTEPPAILLRSHRNETYLLATLFVLIVVAEAFLSIQYFLVLAPKDLCGSRPHFDFLWTSFSGQQRIVHCMSGTDEINKKAPYYLEGRWQIVQAWGHVAWPVLTAVCLVGALRSWIEAGVTPK